MKIETILKYQKKEPVLKIARKRTTEKSRPFVKTPFITASPIFLERYRIFADLHFDENTKLITIKLPCLKSVYKLPQYAEVVVFSRISRLCLPLFLFYSAFDKVNDHSHAGMHIAR